MIVFFLRSSPVITLSKLTALIREWSGPLMQMNGNFASAFRRTGQQQQEYFPQHG